MTLWFVFALMTVAAIFAVLWPLSRGTAPQPGGNVAIDFSELIPVDRRLIAAGGRGSAAAQWPEHGEDRRDRHQREHKPQIHQAGSGGWRIRW